MITFLPGTGEAGWLLSRSSCTAAGRPSSPSNRYAGLPASSPSNTSDLWGRVVKAYGVDTSYQAVDELMLLVGAAGYRSGHWLDKAKRDLNGLLYADGMPG